MDKENERYAAHQIGARRTFSYNADKKSDVIPMPVSRDLDFTVLFFKVIYRLFDKIKNLAVCGA